MCLIVCSVMCYGAGRVYGYRKAKSIVMWFMIYWDVYGVGLICLRIGSKVEENMITVKRRCGL